MVTGKGTRSRVPRKRASETGDEPIGAALQRSSRHGPISGGNASGRATRELLVRTAEQLFAERGIDAVSLREIGQVAGQGNNAAIQYHFGDREALVLAIFEYRSSATDE